MAKDRLEQHIEHMKEALEKAKENIYVKKYLSLQDLLAAAERLNAAIIASEEDIPEMAEPKPRPHRRKAAQENGVSPVVQEDDGAPTVVTEGEQ